MHWTVHEVASQLLDVNSFQDLCVSVLHRCLLDDGRFEAGQFGRKQHSSASAGAVLNGVASLPHLPDDLRTHTHALGFALIGDGGYLRGHDEDPGDGTTSWSLSQVLYGVAKGCRSRDIESPKYAAALFRLLTLQNRADGSWSLRHGDFSDPSLAFYPALLFERLIRRRSSYAERVRESLLHTTAYFLDIAASAASPDINTVLALSALDRVAAIAGISEKPLALYRQRRAELISDLVDEHDDLRICDKHISNELQPRWHSVTWAAILYACTRHWGGIQSSHNLHLSASLLQTFDRAEGGWCGPSRADRTARSWASSLALLNVHLLARDICTSGLEVNEYKGLLRDMQDRKRFDVVISFGGPDRHVAEQIRNHLVAGGLRVFFDMDFRHNLLGEDLTVLLQDIYFRRSRFAVAVLSKSFLNSEWAGNWEWKAVLARMNRQREGYLLPYFLELVDVPGLNPTIGYLSADSVSPTEFAEIVRRKVLSSGIPRPK